MRLRRSKKNFGCPDVSRIVTSRYSAAGYRIKRRSCALRALKIKNEKRKIKKSKWNFGEKIIV